MHEFFVRSMKGYVVKHVQFLTVRTNDILTGFILRGVDCESQKFCVSFLKAYAIKKAEIKVDFGRIRFLHGGIDTEDADPNAGDLGTHPGGDHIVVIDCDELFELVDLCNGEGKYIGWTVNFEYEFSCGKGFRVSGTPPILGAR